MQNPSSEGRGKPGPRRWRRPVELLALPLSAAKSASPCFANSFATPLCRLCLVAFLYLRQRPPERRGRLAVQSKGAVSLKLGALRVTPWNPAVFSAMPPRHPSRPSRSAPVPNN
jgi:hypothetical protein